jgi:predicted permease
LDYLTLLSAVAPVFVMLVAGYTIRRVDWLSTEADIGLLRVVVNLLYPCLILDTILGNPALHNAANLLLAPAVGFVTITIGFAASYWTAPLFGIREQRVRRTFAFTAGIYNYGYIALPLVQMLFGGPATGVLFLHNVGIEISLWTLGIMLLSGAHPRDGWRHILNIPLMAIIAAIALNFAGARSWMPSFILSAVHSMGAAAVPLGIILSGAVFADQLRQSGDRAGGAISLGACALRLGAIPLVMLAIARWLPCPAELRHVILVQAAMPSGVFPVILSKHYGGDAPTALRIVLVTSALGLITIPLWLRFGMELVK